MRAFVTGSLIAVGLALGADADASAQFSDRTRASGGVVYRDSDHRWDDRTDGRRKTSVWHDDRDWRRDDRGDYRRDSRYGSSYYRAHEQLHDRLEREHTQWHRNQGWRGDSRWRNRHEDLHARLERQHDAWHRANRTGFERDGRNDGRRDGHDWNDPRYDNDRDGWRDRDGRRDDDRWDNRDSRVRGQYERTSAKLDRKDDKAREKMHKKLEKGRRG